MEAQIVNNVSLRAMEDADLEQFYRHYRDPEAGRMAAFIARDPCDRDAYMAHWKKIRGMESVIIRTILSNGQTVGHLAKFEMDDQPEITYWIDRAHWGRGIATAAVNEFLQEFADRPLYGHAAADNAGSIRVLEKCGFVHIGITRGFANARGEEIDEVVMRLDG